MIRRTGSQLVYEIRHWEAGPQAHVVTASGELDLVAAPTIRETVMRLSDLGRTSLVIDMSEATFIDSTVIGMLVGRLKALREAGGSLCLVCAEPNVLRTLEIAGVGRVFDIYPTLSDALHTARTAVA
jgi:anti-sigma B factor antagonist